MLTDIRVLADHFLIALPNINTRGHRTLTGSHRTLNPQRPVLRRQPRVTSRLNSTVTTNGYHVLAPNTAPPDALLRHTGPVRRELCKLVGSPDARHRTHPDRQVLTGPVRREGRQNACTPDAEHRTYSGASGALGTLAPQTGTASGAANTSVR